MSVSAQNPGEGETPDEDPGAPLPLLEGHVSHGRLERVLRAGDFAVTSELAPPDSASASRVFEAAAPFDGWVDGLNATDGSGANCHMSSVAVCAFLARAGYSPILQISCRDRNRIAIQGDALGAAALGACSVLCLSGDDVGAGDHPSAKPVFDLDSVSLLQTLRRMRDEAQFLSGRQLLEPPRLFLGASVNPFAPPVDRRIDIFAKKVEAGAQYVQSQYCFDAPMLRDFMKRVVDRGLAERCFVLIGVGVLASAKTARWLRKMVPGVHIPDAVVARLEQADDPKREGREICVEMMQAAAEIEGVRGVHVMAYRQERWVGDVVRRSGVLGGRKPWSASPPVGAP